MKNKKKKIKKTKREIVLRTCLRTENAEENKNDDDDKFKCNTLQMCRFSWLAR